MVKKLSLETAKCPIDLAFHQVGGKHKARIVWHIHENEVLRFGEIRRILTGISPKVLTATLRELETDKLLIRKEYPSVPPRVEYTLTDTGRSLIPFITYLKQWAAKELMKSSHGNIAYMEV